ncbi:hypothetical protein BH23VER1_BH23VER1_18830 [soil metagenome]
MNLTTILIAGGKSSRMGQDKALIEIGGRPLWRIQLDKLQALRPSQIMISARRGQRFLESDTRVVWDEFGGAGPLGAIVTCMKQATAKRVLVLGVDLPGITARFLRDELLLRAFLDSGVVYRHEGRFQPFAAVYPKSVLKLAQRLLSQNRFALQDLITDAIDEGALDAYDLPEEFAGQFANVNTPDDLAAFRSGGSPPAQPSGPAEPGDSGDSGELEPLPAGPTPGAAAVTISRWRSGELAEKDDFVAREEPLEIRVEGQNIAISMRTPGHDEELAAGFLLTEGVIRSPDDIFEVSTCPSVQEDGGESNAVDVLLSHPDSFDLKRLTRHVYTSSSCGVCGKDSIDTAFANFPPIPPGTPGARVDPALLLTLPDKLRAAQETFRCTGGLHACALFDPAGKLLLIREDVGRHNALDKLIGHSLLRGWLPLDDKILFLSGRVSFEMMHKALAARIPMVAAISAPTSLAAEFARASGQGLAGFVRGHSLNLYSSP